MDASLNTVKIYPTQKRMISFKVALLFVISCNFIWAFSHTLLDVLNKHFQDKFHISHGQSAFIQTAYLSAYFLSAIPVGFLMKKYGYRNSIIVGLTLFAVGCMGFVPATQVGTFSAFLIAIFILATGLACLETVCLLYASKLGDPSGAARRLTLTQAFGGLGGMCGPIVGGAVFFIPVMNISGFSVEPATMTYAIISLLIFALVSYIFTLKFPEHFNSSSSTTTNSDNVFEHLPFIKNKNLHKGMIGKFCYTGAHFGIGAFFINFVLEHWHGITPTKAAYFLSIAMFCYMIGRFFGIVIMKYIDPRKIQIFNSLVCAAGCAYVALGYDYSSVVVLIGLFFFKSTLYPTVFAMGVRGMGKKSEMAASLMITMFVGGAVLPLLMGYISDISNMATAFIVPMTCFLLICYCAITQDLTGYNPKQTFSH